MCKKHSDLPGSVIPPLPPKFHMDMHEIKGRFQETGFPPEFLAARTVSIHHNEQHHDEHVRVDRLEPTRAHFQSI